jgi:hypothetical protein
MKHKGIEPVFFPVYVNPIGGEEFVKIGRKFVKRSWV